jgi:dipeptidase E
MKLLLTSAGVMNASIHAALVELLGKPISEASALCIPTAAYPLAGGAEMAARLINGTALTPLCGLGWKSLGVLELSVLPSINEELWVSHVRETDALLVGGGDPLFLADWMRQSGLAAVFPSLINTVYVGVSGGSMVMTPFGGHTVPLARDRALGIVDFSLITHLDHERFPELSMANVERLAATIPVTTYALDDQTALKVVDGAVDVISEGHWKRFDRR